MDKGIVIDSIKNILTQIGDDPERIGLKDTPVRVTSMFKEIFSGYDLKNKPKITLFPNWKDEVFVNSMIIDNGYFFSCCEHHMMPFFGTYAYGYIPNYHIIGISKISRIVDFFSKKLQIQERLTVEIVNFLEDILKPKGSILVIKARHLCKEMRGVRKINSYMETIEPRGFFLENKDNCKNEFISRIKEI